MKVKSINRESMRNLAIKLIDYLDSKHLWDTTGIYVADQLYCDIGYAKPDDIERKTENGTVYYVRDIPDIKAMLEYSNPRTISMIFEGPLYHKINYDDFDFIDKLDKKFLEEYGLYFEQGYAWSMAAYEV